MNKMLHPQIKQNCKTLQHSLMCLIGAIALFLCISCGDIVNSYIGSKQEKVRMKVQNALKEVDQMQQSSIDVEIGLLKLELSSFQKATGRYPTSEEGIQTLLKPLESEGWNGPELLREILVTDLLTKEFKYQYHFIDSDEVIYTITHFGTDKKFGTDDDKRFEMEEEDAN